MENSLNLNDYIKLEVTGVLYKHYNIRNRKRFKLTYPNDFTGRMTAFSINLWRGSIWGKLPNGKRKLLRRIWN